LEVWLVNAKDVKHLPDRPKTDWLDAAWWCKVAEKADAASQFRADSDPPAAGLTRYGWRWWPAPINARS